MSDIAMESSIRNKNDINIHKSHITIGVNCKLTLFDAKLLAFKALPVELHPDSYPEMNRSYQFLQASVDQHKPIYGLNTHFGDQVRFLDPYLKSHDIDQSLYYESIDARQENLIKSHSCGLGD